MRTRDSRFEALRVVAMIAITLNHTPISDASLEMNAFAHAFFYAGGQFGVNLFVLIGAWFLVDQRFKSIRVVRLVFEMFFYSLLLDLICLLMGNHFTVRMFLHSFSYWFCFGYAAMIIIGPFLTKLPIRIRIVLTLISAGVSVIATIIGIFAPNSIFSKLFVKGLFIGPYWFCSVFLFVSVSKTFINRVQISRVSLSLVFLITYLTMFVAIYHYGCTVLREVHSPICFIAALSIFELIRRRKPFTNVVINNIAKITFGAYLFQSHQILKVLYWDGLMRFTEVSECSMLYSFEALINVTIVFCLTMIIEAIRTRLFEAFKIDTIAESITQSLDCIYGQVFDRWCKTVALI